MDLIYILDLIGTFVFAVSGIMVAVKNKFDLIGAAIIGLVTAVGGGTLRDLLIGQTPVAWMKDPYYLLVILAALIVCFFFFKYVKKLKKGFFIFDTIGIALFTILGLQKTLEVGLRIEIALLMGVVSAVFGGVIRDVLTNEVPLIFRKEIYATACLAGGIVYIILDQLFTPTPLLIIPSTLVVFVIRYFAVRKHWEIPYRPR